MSPQTSSRHLGFVLGYLYCKTSSIRFGRQKIITIKFPSRRTNFRWDISKLIIIYKLSFHIKFIKCWLITVVLISLLFPMAEDRLSFDLTKSVFFDPVKYLGWTLKLHYRIFDRVPNLSLLTVVICFFWFLFLPRRCSMSDIISNEVDKNVAIISSCIGSRWVSYNFLSRYSMVWLITLAKIFVVKLLVYLLIMFTMTVASRCLINFAIWGNFTGK